MGKKLTPSNDNLAVSNKLSADIVQPFMINGSLVSGRLTRLDESLNQIIAAHKYPPAVSHMLAELLVITALLGSRLDGEGILTIQLKSDGPLEMMVCDYLGNGSLRGCASYDKEYFKKHRTLKPDFSQVLGRGYFAITLDPVNSGSGEDERYQGVVELGGDSFQEIFHRYFESSEQLEAIVRTGVEYNAKEKKWRSGGILLQRVPAEGGNEAEMDAAKIEDDWQRNLMFADTIGNGEFCDTNLALEDLLYMLFHEEGVWAYDEIPVIAKCRCSEEKLERVLTSMPEADLKHAAIKGLIKVTCDFCSAKYQFSLKDLVQ
jgi:molecular chaperone Hsp33